MVRREGVHLPSGRTNRKINTRHNAKTICAARRAGAVDAPRHGMQSGYGGQFARRRADAARGRTRRPHRIHAKPRGDAPPRLLDTRIRTPGRPGAARRADDRRHGPDIVRPDLGAGLGRRALRPQPLQRAARHGTRTRSARTPFRRGVPPVRRRRRIPLRIPRATRTGRVRHHGRADRIPLSAGPHGLVDAHARALLRKHRAPHAPLADGHGEHAADARMRRRHVPRPARGRPDGLRQDEPSPRRRGGHDAALLPHTVVERREGLRPDAVPHAVAHGRRRRHPR